MPVVKIEEGGGNMTNAGESTEQPKPVNPLKEKLGKLARKLEAGAGGGQPKTPVSQEEATKTTAEVTGLEERDVAGAMGTGNVPQKPTEEDKPQ